MEPNATLIPKNHHIKSHFSAALVHFEFYQKLVICNFLDFFLEAIIRITDVIYIIIKKLRGLFGFHKISAYFSFHPFLLIIKLDREFLSLNFIFNFG